MNLGDILGEAYQRIVFSPEVPLLEKDPPIYDQDWITARWTEFLEERGITKNYRRGWPHFFSWNQGYTLYIPPDLAAKMLVLGYLP